MDSQIETKQKPFTIKHKERGHQMMMRSYRAKEEIKNELFRYVINSFGLIFFDDESFDGLVSTFKDLIFEDDIPKKHRSEYISNIFSDIIEYLHVYNSSKSLQNFTEYYPNSEGIEAFITEHLVQDANMLHQKHALIDYFYTLDKASKKMYLDIIVDLARELRIPEYKISSYQLLTLISDEKSITRRSFFDTLHFLMRSEVCSDNILIFLFKCTNIIHKLTDTSDSKYKKLSLGIELALLKYELPKIKSMVEKMPDRHNEPGILFSSECCNYIDVETHNFLIANQLIAEHPGYLQKFTMYFTMMTRQLDDFGKVILEENTDPRFKDALNLLNLFNGIIALLPNRNVKSVIEHEKLEEENSKLERLVKIDEYYLKLEEIRNSKTGNKDGNKHYTTNDIKTIYRLILDDKPRPIAILSKNKMIDVIINYYQTEYVKPEDR